MGRKMREELEKERKKNEEESRKKNEELEKERKKNEEFEKDLGYKSEEIKDLRVELLILESSKQKSKSLPFHSNIATESSRSSDEESSPSPTEFTMIPVESDNSSDEKSSPSPIEFTMIPVESDNSSDEQYQSSPDGTILNSDSSDSSYKYGETSSDAGDDAETLCFCTKGHRYGPHCTQRGDLKEVPLTERNRLNDEVRAMVEVKPTETNLSEKRNNRPTQTLPEPK